jgi:hypothetical protein
METEPDHGHAEARRLGQQPGQRVQVAAELARQVADHPFAAKGDAQQQAGLGPEGLELGQFVDVVDYEHPAAELQRIADVALALDRVGVDGRCGIGADIAQQVQFAAGGDVEARALGGQCGQGVRVRQRLDCVVQADRRQGRAQLAVFLPHRVAVQHQQR